VIDAYPGDDVEAHARRAAALKLVRDQFFQIPRWGQKTLKAELLTAEYTRALQQLEAKHPAGSADHQAFESRRAALERDQAFREEVAQAFQPYLASVMEHAEQWHETRNESRAFGWRASITLAVVLTGVYVLWAIGGWIGDLTGGFKATEHDGRLDVVYRRSKHGLLALFAAALVWAMLGCIWGVLMTTMDEPEFLKNMVARDPSNEGVISFAFGFLIFAVPAAGLLLLNVLRLGKRRFSITPEAIEVGGRSYPRGEQLELFVQSPATGPTRTIAHGGGGVYFMGSTPMVAAAAAGATVSRAMSAGQDAAHGAGRGLAIALARVGHAIKFTHRDRAVPLARGLSQRRADRLFDRIADFLDAEQAEGPETVTTAAVD
jgi:hypothetical protein